MFELNRFNKDSNEDGLIPESEYEKLFFSGIKCSHCGNELSKDEILMHRHVGIIDIEEMMCQKDWMRVAYTVNFKLKQ